MNRSQKILKIVKQIPIIVTESGETPSRVISEKATLYKTIVEEVLSLTDDRFFTDPSSSTGEHHPAEDNEVGGVFFHTMKALVVGLDLCRCFGVKDEDRAKVLSAIALHDVCKNGYPVWGNRTIKGHGYLVYNLMQETEVFEKYPEECKYILHLISTHMGQWDVPFDLPQYFDYERIVVHLADYIVSRKSISVEWGKYIE